MGIRAGSRTPRDKWLGCLLRTTSKTTRVERSRGYQPVRLHRHARYEVLGQRALKRSKSTGFGDCGLNGPTGDVRDIDEMRELLVE